ncbi:MAG: glycosyltransferase family 39 protein [Bacteroidota bacterium]
MSKRSFLISALLLLALRAFHLGPAIDLPHDWRQCDTAYYIWDFFLNGIDLLHPAVCWMGGHETVALEFPLPEAIVALAYQLFGESLLLARLIFLTFFAGAVYFFYRCIQLLFGQQLAQLSTLAYLVLPLGLFYSRAIHIDFSALLFAHAMLFYYLKSIQTKSYAYLLLSSMLAIPAFLIKAPYVFYLALPMLGFVLQQRRFVWLLKGAIVFAVPVGIFLLWQNHVYQINSAAPDWNYILHYRKFDNNAHWYFGSFELRLSLYRWWVLLQRGIFEVVGIGGWLFFLWGFWKIKNFWRHSFVGLWILGLAGYVLIFFNLNVIHNYYQLPLLAPAALIIAYGLQQLQAWKANWLWPALCLLIGLNVVAAEQQYYQVPDLEIKIGKQIRDHTPAEALVIVSYKKMDCRNPRILYRARRRGWSIEELAIKAEVIERLQQEEGASHWAYIGEEAPALLNKAALSSVNFKTIPLNNSKESLFLLQF